MNNSAFAGNTGKKVLFLLSVILLTLNAQSFSQSVSINTTGTPPNPSAGLDVNFTTKGLLIPRVSLSSTAISSPLSAHVAGMMVYNLATVNDVTPGFYYNDGIKWIKLVLTGSTPGTMLYWDGSKWALLPPGSTGQRLQLDAASIPVWK